MSEQRIERFMLVRHRMAVRAFCFATVGELRDSWPDGDYVRLVEIREGEPRPDKVREITDELQVQAIDASNRLEKAERELKAAIERAEKAEAEVAELMKQRADLIAAINQAGGTAKADERARFERETAARMLAALWGSDWNGDADDATERILVRAAKLADACFGAKEA